MARMVIVAPEEVAWTETISASFTTAVRVTDKPHAYGCLRLDEGRWELFVIMGDHPYGGQDMRRAELVELLEMLTQDIIVLMEASDCDTFMREVVPTVDNLVVERPECLYGSISS